MSLTIYNFRRWAKMLTGKSVWHVNQSIGTVFEKDAIRGYYNNLTEKVTMLPLLMENDSLPILPLEDGTEVEMPVAVFQYGLGAYDLYLQTKDERFLRKFRQAIDWSIDHIDDNGRWSNFFYIYPENPYGAMAQGEGASLLLRAYSQFRNEQFLLSAKRAIDFMLIPLSDGGTTLYKGTDVVFAEYTHLPIVLNGWIFAWWGLYDLVITMGDNGQYANILYKSCASLKKYLPYFNAKYWSKYDLAGKIASPFYHNLHIAQMQAMYQLTGEGVFKKYADLWTRQQKNVVNKSIAFIVKAGQKIRE